MDEILHVAINFFIFILVCVILRLMTTKMMKSNGNRGYQYDERQQSVRGKGYQYAFFTLMIYDLIYALLEDMTEGMHMENSVAIFLGIFLSILIYASYCVWKDGYFAINIYPGRAVTILFLIGMLNFAVGVRSLMRGILWEDGKLTMHSVNLMCGILCLIISVQILAKRLSGKQEENEEYEEENEG